MAVVALVPDLMDRSKVAAAAPGATFVRAADELSGAAGRGDVVLVDLGRSGAVEALPALVAAGAVVVGFAAHVDGALLARAEATGCTVLPRSRFFARLPELLA